MLLPLIQIKEEKEMKAPSARRSSRKGEPPLYLCVLQVKREKKCERLRLILSVSREGRGGESRAFLLLILFAESEGGEKEKGGRENGNAIAPSRPIAKKRKKGEGRPLLPLHLPPVDCGLRGRER